MLIPRLPALAAIPFEHNLYVDGGLNVSDVLVKDSRGATKTKTWLAGALGGGGRGLFMLDVTDPTATTEAAAATTIKWEISSANRDFANLGYTYAAPHQARLNTGEAAVVVGNGYMNTGNGQASLFIINADTGALIREISTGSGRTGSPNGLSTATLVDFDLDGKVDFAYAGDIDGNLWRFDLRGNAAKAWSVTKVLATSPAQAITSAPVVVNHPKGGRMVLFGTGRVLNAADTKDTASYFAYGRWDGAPAANTTWKDQTITEVKADGSRARRVSQNVPKWTSGGDMGWRLKLTAGERIIGEGMYVSGERFSFTTSNPTVASAAADQPTGANWLMEVNALTGGGFPTAIFDVDENGKINAGDNSDTGVVAGHYLGAGVTSQPVLVDLATLSRTLFNLESNVDYTPPPPAPLPLPPPPVPVGGGVSGGHFDVDLYTFGGGYGNVKHTHQYDDVYDVTGVNMLNASDSTFNIGTQLGSTVPFKVLVMNQYLNPALTLSVGGGPYVNVKTYGGLTTAPTATVALAALPSYTLSNVKTLVWNLPLDAFQSKDWWGDGGAVRAGLIPTETKCVNHVEADGTTNRLGANGERFNGALTIQLIKSNTPASALELNYPGGGAKYGWRVTRSEFSNYVLAEYTTFWHHPAHSCYGDGDWVPNPPEDFDEGKGHGKSSEKESGSSDPVGGTYGVDSTGPGTGPGTSGPAPVGVTVVKHTKVKRNSVIIETIVYSDGKRHVTTTVINGDGTEKVTTIDRDGNKTVGIRVTASTIGEAPDETRLDSRRINWREVVRP